MRQQCEGLGPHGSCRWFAYRNSRRVSRMWIRSAAFTRRPWRRRKLDNLQQCQQNWNVKGRKWCELFSQQRTLENAEPLVCILTVVHGHSTAHGVNTPKVCMFLLRCVVGSTQTHYATLLKHMQTNVRHVESTFFANSRKRASRCACEDWCWLAQRVPSRIGVRERKDEEKVKRTNVCCMYSQFFTCDRIYIT